MRVVTDVETSVTETVVQNHLGAFLQQRGVSAIVGDYDDDARFFTDARIYRGKQEIHGFFSEFVASLPAGAIDRFTLRSLQVDGDIALITWWVDGDIPLGTDTFVVHHGKIVSQTFAMCAGAARRSPAAPGDTPSRPSVAAAAPPT